MYQSPYLLDSILILNLFVPWHLLLDTLLPLDKSWYSLVWVCCVWLLIVLMHLTGHGGSRAAEYLKEHLFENLMKHPQFMTDTKLAISAFKFSCFMLSILLKWQGYMIVTYHLLQIIHLLWTGKDTISLRLSFCNLHGTFLPCDMVFCGSIL